MALSGDGVRAATGHWDGSVNIWRLDTGELERQLPGHSNWIASLAFSPDGELLASGSTDDWARVWDVATGVERYPLAHVNDVRVVAFSPDGELLLTSADEAYLWTASTGAAVRTLTTDLPVKTAVFSPDSSRVPDPPQTGSDGVRSRVRRRHRNHRQRVGTLAGDERCRVPCRMDSTR